MPVDARLQQLLDAAANAPAQPTEGLSVVELRERGNAGLSMMLTSLAEEGPAVAGEADHRVPVADGEIAVRVYTPHGDGPFPGHLYLHGGGFWVGQLEHGDAICRWTAEAAGCVVASVDYRLAPEHPYPTPPEDAFAALRWFVDNAGDLGVDATRISVGGSSAGGNLAAVVALLARDRGGPPLVFQVLDIPVTDLTMSQPSVAANGEGYFLTRANMVQYSDFYVPDATRRTEPYASPLFAPDLTGLPPALVMTAEFDPLRDEGEAYAARLRDAGVPTTVRRWEGQFHGAQDMGKILVAEAKEYRELIASSLRAAYGADTR